MKFQTKPWKHQIAALKYLMPRSFGALYTKPGSGKTKIMIDLTVNRGFQRVVIVATNKICTNEVWDKEISKHAPTGLIRAINVAGIAGDKRPKYIASQRELDGNSPIEILIVNYESVWREPFKTYLLKKYRPDCVICDESHRIKSPGSKCSRMLTQLGKIAPNRFLMTGTPLAQSPLDIYAQYRFLCTDIFGTNFGNFKHRYANWIPLNGFEILDKNNPYKNLDELHEKMFSCAFMAEVDLDLPPTRDIMVDFELGSDAQKLYAEARKEGCLDLKHGVMTTGNVLTLVTRLQQLSSGYVKLDDGTVEEVDTARVDAFRELAEGFPYGEQVVVFAKYRKDIKNVRKTIAELGRTSSELSGRKDTSSNWIAGKTQFLVVQIAAGAEGLNELVRARYAIYYTLTHSNMLMEQSRKRLDRPGQTRPVTYYILVAHMKRGKTIDERILEAYDEHKDLVDLIFDLKAV